jgi:inhibitor of cysteine peptidase
VVTDEDKGRDVEIKVGDTLEVRLASNPSTGYMWYVHPKSTALLKLIGQTHTDAADPGVGRPIVQVFTFQPRRASDVILLLRYARAWEKPVLGQEQFSLHVVIE